MSTRLKHFLELDKPPSSAILLLQLQRVLALEQPRNDHVRLIIQFLALSDSLPLREEVKATFQTAAWLPTATEELAPTLRCLAEPFPLPLYHQIHPSFKEQAATLAFLNGVGLRSTPSINDLLDVLATSEDVDNTIKILEYLAKQQLDEEQQKRLVIPDAQEKLRPLSQVVFGDSAFDVELPTGLYETHARVSSYLAGVLRLRKTSELAAQDVLEDEYEDFEPIEKRTIRIRGKP
jgi:hypothetical protein